MHEFKNYHDNGQLYHHYWRNEKGRAEGEYKSWRENGQLAVHSFFKNGMIQGEYKSWKPDEQLAESVFMHNGEEIDINEYVTDVNNITEQEYFHLQLVFGYFPIIKFYKLT